MSLIEWKEDFSVNIREIDEQHKKLIDLLNKLNDAMRKGQGKAILGSVFDEVIQYTDYHFKFEEKYFEKYGYIETAEHKELHDRLINRVMELKGDFERGHATISIEVMKFLKEWILTHIGKEDKKYSEYLNSKGVH